MNPLGTGLSQNTTLCNKDYKQTGVSVRYAFFLGVEGGLAHVPGKQRVLVETDGLFSIATAYIPSAFLRI